MVVGVLQTITLNQTDQGFSANWESSIFERKYFASLGFKPRTFSYPGIETCYQRLHFLFVENELHVERDVDDDVEDDVGVWVEVDDEVLLHVSLL